MLQKKYFFSYKKSIKISNTRNVLGSFCETNNKFIFYNLILKYKFLQIFFFKSFFLVKETREVVNCLIKDMIHLTMMWRHIRGYPQGGNTTHTNSNTSKKNKLLLNFRINQFHKYFGQKKRDIYPTLVKAEYTNRLWFHNWYAEWKQAFYFSFLMIIRGQKAGIFNPVLLAGHQTNGYVREGKAAKISKAKRLVKVCTIGVPIFFTRFIYLPKKPKGFPRITLKDEVNKKLGKKLRRRVYKKR